MSQGNVEIIRRLFAARAQEDMDGAVSCLAEDVEIDASRRTFDPMVVNGHEGFRQFIAALDEAWAQQAVEPDGFIDAGDQIVVAVRLTSTGHSGATVAGRAAWVVRVEQGKITRACVYQSTNEALAAVGLSE
jgi:ketosteroid isomerase-like protein